MYIQKAQIKNVRSIIDFEIEFPNPAGWHVLIGDNGAGKSTIIRSMALALVGYESQGLRANWEDWLNKKAEKGRIELRFDRHQNFDKVEISTVLDLEKLDKKKDYLKAIHNDELNIDINFYRDNAVKINIMQASPMK